MPAADRLSSVESRDAEWRLSVIVELMMDVLPPAAGRHVDVVEVMTCAAPYTWMLLSFSTWKDDRGDNEAINDLAKIMAGDIRSKSGGRRHNKP